MVEGMNHKGNYCKGVNDNTGWDDLKYFSLFFLHRNQSSCVTQTKRIKPKSINLEHALISHALKFVGEQLL
jgi:hypothetical protein